MIHELGTVYFGLLSVHNILYNRRVDDELSTVVKMTRFLKRKKETLSMNSLSTKTLPS